MFGKSYDGTYTGFLTSTELEVKKENAFDFFMHQEFYASIYEQLGNKLGAMEKGTFYSVRLLKIEYVIAFEKFH